MTDEEYKEIENDKPQQRNTQRVVPTAMRFTKGKDEEHRKCEEEKEKVTVERIAESI